MEKIDTADRKTIAQALAATWRGHSTGGVGPNPGAFEISDARVETRALHRKVDAEVAAWLALHLTFEHGKYPSCGCEPA